MISLYLLLFVYFVSSFFLFLMQAQENTWGIFKFNFCFLYCRQTSRYNELRSKRNSLRCEYLLIIYSWLCFSFRTPGNFPAKFILKEVFNLFLMNFEKNNTNLKPNVAQLSLSLLKGCLFCLGRTVINICIKAVTHVVVSSSLMLQGHSQIRNDALHGPGSICIPY